MSKDRPTAIIADDEESLRHHLRRHLADAWPDLTVLGEAEDGESTLRLIESENPDVVFLDIRMPGLDGIAVANQVNLRCRVVFVTAYDEYAVGAFEQAAVDYLLKPVTAERLMKTVTRLRKQMSIPPPDLTALLHQIKEAAPPRYREWVKVAHREEIQLIAMEEIDFFRATDKYTSVFCKNREWLIRTSLKSLEKDLDPERFWRIHRAIIVRASAITSVRRDWREHYFAHLEGYEQPLEISRRFVHRFKQD